MKKIASILLGLVLIFSFSACGLKDLLEETDADYSRYPTDYDPDIDSWEQIDPGDEDVNITWFMDFSYSNQNLEDLIYKRTGVRVTFQNALNNTHDELNTALSGNKLPDVISLDNTALRIQLAEEGYCYAINKLAESYAPSMLKRVSDEHWNYYKSSDGNTYTLASNFYNDADVAEFEEMGGNQYANGGLMVRKDWLNDYIEYRTAQDASFDADSEITRPSGFLEMCRWVKANKGISAGTSTLLLAPFPTTATNDIISQSLTALMEFMGVPMEDAEGNLVYQYGTEEFYDVIEFLNQAYRDGLIFSGNFAYKQDDVTTQILNGRPFAFVGNDQVFRSAFAKREMQGYSAATNTVAEENEYVSILLTNEAGDAPLMMDFAGRGLYNVMITRNCKREDRVIKVLDYLMSEQGMREMVYGETEGEYYNFTVRPGETNPATGKPSTYGVIEPTQKLKEAVANGFNQSVLTLGVGRLSPLVNSMYARMVSPSDDFAGIVAPWYWTVYKNKKTYFGYTYSRIPFRYPLDVSDRQALNEYSDRQADIETVWIEALPQLIMAESAESCRSLYEEALQKSYGEGVEEWLAFRNKCFVEYKKELGIDYAWPKVDPDYVAPEVTLYGNAEQYMDRPAWVYGGKEA